MAETGRAKMVDAQPKSLVSEQYLDGWPLDDEEEEDSETETSKAAHQHPPSQEKGSSAKRSRTEEEAASLAEPKKLCISLKGKPSVSNSDTGSSGSSKKITMNLGGSASKQKMAAPIKMNLSSQTKQEAATLVKKSSAVAKAFGGDSDDSEEEMPPEARMRMRNIGRETPTAAGPNSFGKGRLGFCDRQKIIERELQQKSEDKK